MKKIFSLSILWILSVTISSAQVNLNNQVLVYFITGVQRAAPANTTSNITSATVLNLLGSYGIPASNVVPSFPEFNEADTVNAELGEASRQMNRAKVFTITVTNPSTKTNLINDLSALAEVLYAESNGTVSNNIIPVDGRFGQQWNMRNTIVPGADIHLDGATNIFTGNPNAIIAIIDDGVDRTHNDLDTKITGGDIGITITQHPAIPTRVWSHGSHVAGIAAAISNNNNNNGVAGVDWAARIHPKNIFDGNGDPDITTSIIDAVNFSPNVWTLNNSWGTRNNDGTPGRYSVTIRSAFAHAYRNNRVSCIAMGNHQTELPNLPAFPASINSGVIAVGATDINDNVTGFSANGPHIDVAAPGNFIWSTNFNNGYIDLSGTSMATPHVAGLASLLKGFNTNLANDDIEQIIRLSADDLFPAGADNASGTGRINAERALQFLQAPNTVQHLSVTGGTVFNTSANMTRIFLGVPGLSDAAYIVKRIEVRRNVTFPAMCNIIGVWGRGVGTTGFREENGRNFGEGICEVVPGTLTGTGCTLRTWVYEIWTILGQYIGFRPVTPANVTFQYSILGNPSPVQSYTISGPQTPCTNALTTYQLDQNPPAGSTVTWTISPNDGTVLLSPSGSTVSLDATNATRNVSYTLTVTVTGSCQPIAAQRQFTIPSQGWQGSITGYYGWSNPVYSGPLVEGDNYLYTGTSAQYFEIWNEGINSQPYTGSWEYVSGDRASYSWIPYYIGFDLAWLSGVDSYYNYNYTDECGTHSVPYHFISAYSNPPYYRTQLPKEKYQLKISPNPASSFVNVSVMETEPGQKAGAKEFDYNTPKTIRVYNKQGILLIQRNEMVSSSGLRLNVSMLKSGDLYNVIVEDKNGLRLSGRFVKQ